MKKSVLAALSFVVMTFMASCTKESTKPVSTWTVDNKTIKTDNTFYDYSNFDPFVTLTAYDKTKGSVMLFFLHKPTADKNYTIVKPSVMPFDENSVYVYFFNADSSSYCATKGNVSVTIKNSKALVKFNDLAVVAEKDLLLDSTCNASGTIIEN